MPFDDWGFGEVRLPWNEFDVGSDTGLSPDIDSDTGLPADVVRRYYAPCKDAYDSETTASDSHDSWDDASSERVYSSDLEPFDYSDSEEEESEEWVSEDEDGNLVARRSIRIQRSRCCMLPRMPVEILQMVRLVFVDFPPSVF
jgi:hypothetical protein